MKELENKKDAIVIDLYLTEQDNSVKNIAEITGLLEITVHQIINKYLKTRVVNE